MLGAYAAYDPNDPNFSVRFLFDWQRWDAYAFPIILAVLTWLGDILVIYRCFLIWQRNYYVIILPVILLLASIGTTSVNLWWFRHTSEIPWSIMKRLFNVTYPLNFVQNVLTTGFIAYRIYTQYRASKAAHDSISSKLNFIAIMRIIVESALIYTVQMLLLIILWYTGSPALVIVQHAIAPSIGIVFVLIAIRTHVAKTAMGIRGSRSGSFSIMPTWLSGDDRTNHRGGENTGRHVVPNFTSTSEDLQLEFINRPRKSIIEFAPPTSGVYDDYTKV
ncbi:hypothetical protein EST38_g4296 [Candolleomyces aberdarensis]|uniref:Uncharacterized protein n=1 Tax=Candolleomyces aberdarensis TaxID=2316362 RepID=A0A4Q2DNA5_9AGAR|nr:hypothetical protein EST38_g4296 [Candolleomyces aberdarensis]